MYNNDSSHQDRKNNRRDSLSKKKSKHRNRDEFDARDLNKIQKEFKHKKKELYQDELWEEWQDEIS